MSDLPADVAATVDGLSRLCRTAAITRSARMALVGARDREHALSLIEEVAVASGTPAHHVTPAGTRRFDARTLDWAPVKRSDLTPAQMLDQALALGGGLVVMEQLVAQLQDASPHVQARVQLADLLARDDLGPHGLVLACLEAPDAQSQLPALLSEQVDRFVLGYPRAAELSAMTRAELAQFAHRAGRPISVDAIRTHADALAGCQVGLTRKAARDTLRDALVDNFADLANAEAFLQRKKTERLSRELSMEVLDTNGPAEAPLGVEQLLEFIEIQKPSMRLYGPERARGVLLIGPPGVGKTMLARAAGRLTGLPVVVLRVGSLMNSLLGATERLFSQAFATLEAMAPCIVFIDELEKAFGDNSERDGGTMMRVTGSLLSWLSDNPHPNYIIATCNGIDRMGEIGKTMTRSGRFDASYFLDVPAPAARRAIWAQSVGGEFDTDAVERLVDASPMFSGADIHSVVKLAKARATYQGAPLSLALLEAEIARKATKAAGLHAEFNSLRQWAALNAEPAAAAE